MGVYLLAVSALLNIALGVVGVRTIARWRWRRLPRERPNWTSVEEQVRAEAERAEVSSVVAVERVEPRRWLCRIYLVHKVPDIRPYMTELNGLLTRVSGNTGIPARVFGYYLDHQNPPRVIGTIIEFGYSREVGYRIRNEFIKRRTT